MSEENTTPELSSTPTGDSYDTSISTPETAGGTEPTEAPFSLDVDTDFFGEGSNPTFAMATGAQDKGSVSGETLKDLTGYTTRFTNLDQAFMDAAITQGPMAAIGNGLVRAGAEVVGGTIEGFGALAGLFDDERMHHENFLEELGRGIRESTDDFDIWERNAGASWQFGDAAWWAKNLPSMASTIAMMIPAGAVAKGISFAGKGLRTLGKAAKVAQSGKAAKVGNLVENITKDVAGGMTMRHAENMREAHQTFEDARTEFMASQFPLEHFKDTHAYEAFAREHGRRPANKAELADYVGGAAARGAYKFNSMNLIFDIAQFSGFGRMYKTTRGAATAATRAAAAGKTLSRSQRFANTAGKVGKFAALDMGTEGIEEMVNHVGGKEGLYHALRMVDLGKESTIDERMQMYANDDHMWEAAFWGALGGGVFTGARAAMNKVSGKGTKQQERILEQARHRQEVASQSAQLAKDAADGKISESEAREKAASLQMEQAFVAAQNGTAELFEDQIDAALAQMQKEGVSEEQRTQFAEDSKAALAVAEQAVTEANLIMGGLEGLTPEARTILTHSLAGVAHDQLLNKTRQDGLSARAAEDADFDAKRGATIRESLSEIETILGAMAKEDPRRANIEATQKYLTTLAAELPDVETVVDEKLVSSAQEKVDAAKAKVEELRAAIPNQQDNEAAKKQLADELADALTAQTEAQKELDTAKEGTTPTYNTEDKLVEDYISTELEDMRLTDSKKQMLSAEGIEALKNNADKLKEAIAEKEAKDRAEGQEERSEEELKSEQKRLTEEDDAARLKEIERELEQRRLDRENKNQSKLEQRSKDIEVSEAAQAAIEKLVTDTENLELVDENGNPSDGNGKYYRDKRTGQLFMRTTTFINGGKTKNIDKHWSIPSTNIGNSVDMFVRDYFDGNIGKNEYPHLSEELQAKLQQELFALEEKLVANGEKVVPHDVTLMARHEAATKLDENVEGIAGTVDLLTVDKEGNLRIYDMKTVRDAAMVKDVWKDGKKTGRVGTRVGVSSNLTTGEAVGVWGERQDKEQAESYNRQVSTYAIMAELSTGLPVVEGGIIPIDVAYDTDKRLSDEELNQITAGNASLLPVIPQELQPEVGGLKVDPVEDVVPDDAENTTQEEEVVPEETPEVTEDEVETGDDVSVVDVPVEEAPFTVPVSSLVSYFAEKLKVVTDWNRDNMLVHGSDGAVVIGQDAYAEQYKVLQEAMRPNSGAVVKFKFGVDSSAGKYTTFRSMLKNGGIMAQVGNLQEVTDLGKGTYSYTPGLSDRMNIIVTINDVPVGSLPTTAELLEASSKRFDSVSKKQYADRSFSTHRRANKAPDVNENLIMSEQSQEAHLQNAVAINKLRNALLAVRPANFKNTEVRVELTPGTTTMGLTAVGSPILDTSRTITAENVGVGELLAQQGIALALPGPDGKTQVVQRMGETKETVTPYGQNEQVGASASGMGRYSSGSMFVPIQQPGQPGPMWLRVPGQTVSELTNGKSIAVGLASLLNSADRESISMAQNILGSRAIRERVDENGNNIGWAIYPTNRTDLAALPPISEYIDGQWTVDVEGIIPEMNVDIAVSVAEGESAYRTGGELDFDPTDATGSLLYNNLGEFVAKEMVLGYAPVTDKTGDILGWTHPMAPAYARNDTNPGNSANYEGKVLFNENANRTQMRLGLTPIAVEGVSGAELMQQMTAQEETEVKTDAEVKKTEGDMKTAETAEEKKQLTSRLESLKKTAASGKVEMTPESWNLTPEQQAIKEKLEAAKKKRRWLDVSAQEAAQNAEKNTAIDVKVADAWWSENMPNVPFKRVKGMIERNGKVGYGIFEEGAVQVSDLGIRGVEYHEAFHAVFAMYLDPKRQEKVLEDARRMYGKKLSEEQLEERLAEDFREYMLTNGLSNKEKSVVRRFFSELMELIKALAKDGFAGARKMYLAQQINNGKFASKDARVINTAQRWMEADLPVWAMNEVNREELNGVVKRFAFETFNDREIYGSEALNRILNEGEASVQENMGVSKWEAASRELLNMTFDGAMAFGFADARAAMDSASAAYENSGRLMTEERAQVIEAMATDRKFQNWVKQLTAGTETAGTDTTSQYNEEAFGKMNPKDSLSQNVRNLIETTPQVTAATLRNAPRLKNLMTTAQMLTQNAVAAKKAENLTEYERLLDNINEVSVAISDLIGTTAHSSIFGMPRGMNLDLNFTFMSQELSKSSSPSDMINKLYELGNVYPEYTMLAIRLANESTYIQGQFFNGFKRTDTNEVQVDNKFKAREAAPFNATLSFQNQSNVARNLADTDITDLTKRLEVLKAKLPTLDPAVQTSQVIKALGMVGFTTIDPAALPVVVEETANGPAGVAALTGIVTAAINVARAYQATTMAKDDNAYNDAQRGFANKVGLLSNVFNSRDRGAVQSQVQNVASTRVHSKQVPSFIGRWFDSLNKRAGESSEAHEKRVRDMFKDPRFTASNHYRLIFNRRGEFKPEAAAKLNALRLGGFATGKDGVSYTQMSDSQRLAFQWASMNGVDGVPMFPITTPSDAGGSYMVPGVVFDPTSPQGKTKTLQQLRDIINAEAMWLKAPGRKGRFSNAKVDAYMRTQFKGTEGDFWSIETTAENAKALDEAANILFNELMAEAEILREHPDFTSAIDNVLPKSYLDQTNKRAAADNHSIPVKMVFSQFVANWSHATVLAGTHNEFKQKAGKNTVDMQKRHKHVLSPTITPSGVSPKSEFKSVTLKDVKRDLTTGEGGTANLAKWWQYTGVEVADAQTWVSPDMYEAVLIESGDWTPEYGEAFETLRQNGTLSSDMHNKLMRPFKPFYYQRIFNEEIGMMESVQIKNSIIPVIPGISPEFDKMAEWMKNNTIDQIQMGTAHKVGNNRGEVELVNDNGEFEQIAFDEANVHTLPMTGYGKQVHNPDHWHNDSTNTLMSQMQRISAAAAISYMGAEGIQIANEFADNLDQLYAEQHAAFMDTFKNEAGNFDSTKFGNWLAEELADSDLPQSTMDLIAAGQFTAPQVAPLMRSRVFSAVENNSKNIKVVGGTAVQISSQFHTTRANRLKGQRLGKSGAKTVTKTVKGKANNRTMMEDLFTAVYPGEFAVVVSEGETRPLTVEDLELGINDNTLNIEQTTTNGLGMQSTSITGVEGVTTQLFRRRIEQFAKENDLENTDVIDALDYDGMIQEIKDDEQLAKEDPDYIPEPAMPTLKAYAESLGADQEVTVEEGGQEVVLPAEVIVSRDFLPKKYRNKEKFPDVESIRAVAPEVLEMFTVRIPSESPNSGSLCTVVDFLPDGMDGVIVPDEFVTQMGSDFDVDKLFFIWKDGKEDSLNNKLYDGMTAPFRDPRVLDAIQAPQGFDTLAALAEQKSLRPKEGAPGYDTAHINNNPYSLLTHHMLTSDNMAGIALKGQAANKNLILLDSIHAQMEMSSTFVFGAGVNASFNWKPSAKLEAVKAIHAEMVAAAMDGAKDPVYGKLGVTNENFNLFSTIILTGLDIPSYETYSEGGTTFDIPGSVSFAVEVVQSEPARLEAAGHIKLRTTEGGQVVIESTSSVGSQYVKDVAKKLNKKLKDSAYPSVVVPQRMQLNPRRQESWEMASAIANFKSSVVKPLKEQGDAMRIDRKSVRDTVKDIAITKKDSYSVAEDNLAGVSKLTYLGKDNKRVDNPFDVRVKGTVRKIFEDTITLLTNSGDNYLQLLNSAMSPVLSKAVTEQAYDSYIGSKAADELGAMQVKFTQMGERTTREVSALPENPNEFSLEQWERYLKRQPETAANADLALVLSKMLLQPKPYQFSDGAYADNITLTGISDDFEKLQVQKAIQRLYDQGGDMKMFIDAMTGYEAQRSRFNMSQGRFTAILPAQIHNKIAAAADVSPISDGMLNVMEADSQLVSILQNQIYNAAKLPFGGKFEDLLSAKEALEDSPARGPRQVQVDGKIFIGLPRNEDEDGEVSYRLYEPTNASKSGEMQNFAGRSVTMTTDFVDVAPSKDDSKEVNQSRIEYGKDLRPAEKIAFFKNRFAKAGVPVRVEMDSDLGANAEVRIENGSAVVVINPNMLQGDTIAHEFGHILVEGLGYNHPAVQALIGELKGTDVWNEVETHYPDLATDPAQLKKFHKEIVVTALGRAATKEMEQGKLRTLINKLFRALGKMFGIKPKAMQQLVDMLLAEGPIPAFNLEGVQTVEEQRGRKTGTDVTREFEEKWGNLAYQLQTRKFTNTQFEVAAARLTREQTRVTKAKTIGAKLTKIGEAAQAELRSAAGITARLQSMTKAGFRGTKMTMEEAALLTDVHTALQSLETLRQVLSGMDPEGADANSKIREQYLALQEELDRLMRAEAILKEELASTISQQLASLSVDKDIKKFVEEDGNLIFDMINDPDLRSRMTDVTAVEKGTLGISEFKNPVIQLIAKQVATAVEAGRLEGRNAEMRVADILKNAAAEGVTVDELIDRSTGKFITEHTAGYAEGSREARIALQAGNEGEYLKFHAANSEMPYTSSFVKEYLFGTIDLRKKLAEVQELRSARKTFGMSSLDGAIEQAEAELTVLLEKRAPLIRKYNTIEISDTFEAARKKEGEKGEEALVAFDNEHGVIDGVPMNENSRFVTIKPIESYVNKNYSGDGNPMPSAKNINPKFANLSSAARATLESLQAELVQAMGADSKFIEEGSVPYYKVRDEKVDWRTKIKQTRESLKKGADKIANPNQEGLAERVLEDAGGRNIYTRDRKVFAATAEQVAKFDSLDALAKHLGEAVKDAHKESAKATMESFAYLSRDTFDSTEVIDGKHVILVGKKGERARQLRSREVAGTKISVALDQWLEGMLGENWEDASSLDAPVAAFQTYTSTMGLAVNPLAWFNNFAYGNVQRWLEVRGGEFYAKDKAKRARSVIGSDIMGITNDIVSGKRSGYSSPVSALINLLDIADDQREMPFGKRESSYSKTINALFVGQTMGEVVMQNHTAFAIMMDTKVVLANGTETNLYDAMVGTFSSESGTVGLPEGATVEYQDKMVPLDSNYLALFRNRAKAINHYIHGAYNKQDAGTWQREAWGRALMQFRRWLPMNLKKRFASGQTNERRERYEQGWYRSMFEFMGIVINNARDMNEMKNAVQAMKEDSPHVYKGAMNGLIEVGSGLAMFMLLAMLYGLLDEEDEDDYLTAIALNRSQRLMQEMNTYTPWGLLDTFSGMAENPFAAFTRVEGLGKIFSQGMEDMAGFAFKGEGLEIYKTGMNKGRSKLGMAFAKSTPILSHGLRLSQVADVQKQWSTAKNIADWFEK